MMWLPRTSNLPSPAGPAMPAQGEWVQRKEGGTIPAHNFDISKFRHCKPIRFYLFRSEPPSPAPPEAQTPEVSLPLGKPAQHAVQCHLQLCASRTRHWCLLPPRRELYLHHRPSTLTRLSYDAERPLCKHSLGQQNFCASRRVSFSVTLANPTKRSSQHSCTHCRALDNKVT